MAHLASRPGAELAVKMKLNVRYCGCARPVWFAVRPEVAQQIRHRRWSQLFHVAQRQPAYTAKLLFKLAGDIGVYRKVA